MRVCVKLCLVNHTLKYGTLFDGEELARKATLMRTADRLQTKIGLQSNKCKLMVRFNKSYNQERYLSSWLADLKWTATTLLKNSSILESLKGNFAPVPRPQETFQCQTSSVLQELFGWRYGSSFTRAQLCTQRIKQCYQFSLILLVL